MSPGALEIAQIGAYGLASGLYLGMLLGGGARLQRWARGSLSLGLLVQLVDIGVRCFALRHPLSSTAEALAFVAFLVAGGFLLASLRQGLTTIGAFVAPTVLVLVVLARVLPDEAPARAPGGALAFAHVLLSTAGEALFALAALVAIVYLVQERRLKRKDFSDLQRGGASLETLERLSALCVLTGFPLFSLAIVSGAVLVARAGVVQSGHGLRPEYLLAVASWLAYGALIIARRGAGWRGRRAAWLTVAGFVAALLVLLGYFLRQLF